MREVTRVTILWLWGISHRMGTRMSEAGRRPLRVSILREMIVMREAVGVFSKDYSLEIVFGRSTNASMVSMRFLLACLEYRNTYQVARINV